MPCMGQLQNTKRGPRGPLPCEPRGEARSHTRPRETPRGWSATSHNMFFHWTVLNPSGGNPKVRATQGVLDQVKMLWSNVTVTLKKLAGAPGAVCEDVWLRPAKWLYSKTLKIH